jgi:hypothetical protein
MKLMAVLKCVVNVLLTWILKLNTIIIRSIFWNDLVNVPVVNTKITSNLPFTVDV